MGGINLHQLRSGSLDNRPRLVARLVWTIKVHITHRGHFRIFSVRGGEKYEIGRDMDSSVVDAPLKDNWNQHRSIYQQSEFVCVCGYNR